METHNLLKTAAESKSEIVITRECAITVLILALSQAEQQSNVFAEKSQWISRSWGKNIIFGMCVSTDDKVTSILNIWCALTLLECINKVKIDGNILGLNDHEIQLFCEILKTFVQDESWIKSASIYKDVYNSKIIADIVSLLMNLIAKSKSSVIFEHCSVFFIIRLLPTPQEQVERKLTVKSIC